MLGDKIKECRIKKGLTQTELGMKIGQPREVICRWEKGKHQPNIIVVMQIANVLGVGLDELLLKK